MRNIVWVLLLLGPMYAIADDLVFPYVCGNSHDIVCVCLDRSRPTR